MKKPVQPKHRILIVDDHPMMREGLAQLIDHEPDLVAASQAESARQALESIGGGVPDLLLLDISLPDKNGLEVIKDVQTLHPELASWLCPCMTSRFTPSACCAPAVVATS